MYMCVNVHEHVHVHSSSKVVVFESASLGIAFLHLWPKLINSSQNQDFNYSGTFCEGYIQGAFAPLRVFPLPPLNIFQVAVSCG